MKLKKKNVDEEKKQGNGIRERVEELRKEEAKARRAERPKYLPDKRTLTVIITAVLCFLIVVGGIYMVSRLRGDNKYNKNNLASNSSVSTVESISSSKTETVSSIISGQTENNSDSSSAAETHEPDSDNHGYHPIKRPDTSSSTVSSPDGVVSSRPESSRDPGSSVPNVPQQESSSLGVEDIDVGTLFH